MVAASTLGLAESVGMEVTLGCKEGILDAAPNGPSLGSELVVSVGAVDPVGLTVKLGSSDGLLESKIEEGSFPILGAPLEFSNVGGGVDGSSDASSVGDEDVDGLGVLVGSEEGSEDGVLTGSAVGIPLGPAVGVADGSFDGLGDGKDIWLNWMTLLSVELPPSATVAFKALVTSFWIASKVILNVVYVEFGDFTATKKLATVLVWDKGVLIGAVVPICEGPDGKFVGTTGDSSGDRICEGVDVRDCNELGLAVKLGTSVG